MQAKTEFEVGPLGAYLRTHPELVAVMREALVVQAAYVLAARTAESMFVMANGTPLTADIPITSSPTNRALVAQQVKDAQALMDTQLIQLCDRIYEAVA